jgi:hypothetical protein
MNGKDVGATDERPDNLPFPPTYLNGHSVKK